ncbi:MAG: hypothetical protein KatS3mg015_1338 [Fimbriimonadales bacterium]|nr:MAG: hypothetical protein KatS3mg015_1338 [Fimbriimonadales bacterium]
MRKAWLPTISLLVLVALIGCQKSEATKADSTDAKADQVVTEIPSELLTEGARVFGAPWKTEQHYKMTITGPQSQTAFLVRRAEVKKVGDAVRVVFTNIGGPLHGNTDTYELRPDGVWAIGLNNAEFSQAFITLPAEMKPGYTWTYKATIQQGGSETVLDVKAEIVGKADVTVPLGTFKAWKVVTTGSSTINGMTQTLKDVIYYAEGVGMVKDEMTLAQQQGSNSVETAITMEAVPAP